MLAHHTLCAWGQQFCKALALASVTTESVVLLHSYFGTFPTIGADGIIIGRYGHERRCHVRDNLLSACGYKQERLQILHGARSTNHTVLVDS